MKVTLNPYTHDPVVSGDLLYANDIIELRNNTEKLLSDFHKHIGTHNPDDGGVSESDNTIREHSIVTNTASGFAPRNIDNILNEARETFYNLKEQVRYDCYPELSIAIWSGKKSDKLPDGWLFCDGQSVLYTDEDGRSTYTPDLSFTEVVAVGADREFLSRGYSQKRIGLTSPSTENPGEGISKWWIIKKPLNSQPVEKISLTVIQPTNGVRIDTNYTSSGDIEYLQSLEDGDKEVNDRVPINTSLSLAELMSDTHAIDKLNITHSKTGVTETLVPPCKLTTSAGDNLVITATVKKRNYTFTIKKTSNQTITVTCGDLVHTSTSTADVTFDVKGGDTWTATIKGATYYSPGTLSKTSGTITSNEEVSATNATLTSRFTINATLAYSIYGATWEALEVTSPKTIGNYRISSFTDYTDISENPTGAYPAEIVFAPGVAFPFKKITVSIPGISSATFTYWQTIDSSKRYRTLGEWSGFFKYWESTKWKKLTPTIVLQGYN